MNQEKARAKGGRMRAQARIAYARSVPSLSKRQPASWASWPRRSSMRRGVQRNAATAAAPTSWWMARAARTASQRRKASRAGLWGNAGTGVAIAAGNLVDLIVDVDVDVD